MPIDRARSAALRRAACGIVAVAAIGAADFAAGATHTVTIEGMRFAPPSLTVEQGDTIVWVNHDLVAHTATAARTFDSHEIAPQASWAYVARRPGRYAYACALHPTMKAVLIVRGKR
ncbi:cupredoxin family copper-binding protein [Trinickia caryophylli]|nr:cupredoxin family copper-binding protein [Trinickia caryophylli]PMS12578.1 hypothetical protein C0Z17_09410 [Trinickia caryophylli]TRX19783.1 hypothetical protein FNF07_17265 [Trinickia caryophylli]WQE12889.1 cupredoxin family copper-binding protein [Trinickia caryophylli]GLU30613.1 hypothetical protein Busp01_04550 [Trinickia caryophylli]